MESSAYDVFGRRVQVDSEVPAVLRLLDAIYDRQRVPLPDDPSLRMIVRGDGAAGPCIELGERRVRAPSRAQLAHHAHLVLVNAAAALADGCRVLHAGALVSADRALLVVGRSGWGKTTLTTALLQRGWRLLSDDFAVLRPTGVVTPFPRRLNLTDGSLARLGLEPPEGTPVIETAGGTRKWMVDPERLWPGCLAAPATATWLCLLSPATDGQGDETRQSGAPWHLELDHAPDRLIDDLAALPGVTGVERRGAGQGPPRLTLETRPGARLVAGIERCCQRHDVALLSARRGDSLHPRFEGPARLEAVAAEAILDELLAQDLSLSGRRFLFGTDAATLMRSRLELWQSLDRAGPACFRLRSGPVSDTAELLDGLRAGGRR